MVSNVGLMRLSVCCVANLLVMVIVVVIRLMIPQLVCVFGTRARVVGDVEVQVILFFC